MSPERRAALMAYCHIDELTAEDEILLERDYLAAVGYMDGAGVSEPEEGTPRRAQYDLCVDALVLDSWDRRGTMDTGRGANYQVSDNASFRRTLNQLKRTEPVSNLDTGGIGGPMYVNAGELDKRITIFRKPETDADGYLPDGAEPVPVHDCWARFSQTSGRELVENNADFGEAKVRFLIRYTRKEIDRKMFVRYRGRDYEIVYINTYGDSGEYMELWCERRSPEGGQV